MNRSGSVFDPLCRKFESVPFALVEGVLSCFFGWHMPSRKFGR
jgi:hypothetical protein